MMAGNDEETWVTEVIRTVKTMTQQMIEFRQDISRATLPLYPRIVEMERARELDGKERVLRQVELDQKIAGQNAVASKQGAAIAQVTSAVKAQGELLQAQSVTLNNISRRAYWGRMFDVVQAAVVIGIAVYWLWFR